ncbi:MAG: polysaccharide deacetylase family protein [Ginsengibacter sp.]
MFYLTKAPWLLKKYYSECTWHIKTDEKTLYLTFDDGPDPEATTFVLSELKKYNARATFFCIGKNVEENFELYKQVLMDGHKVGNHTHDHLNGWKTPDTEFLRNIEKAAKFIDTSLFRPPYGKITKFQLSALAGEKFRLRTIMWDVLSGDFDTSVKPENCYLNVVKNAKKGSIVVFHDSKKAFPNLKYTLPRVLEYYSEKGYVFKSIPSFQKEI